MIYDLTENLNQYRNLFENLDTAIDYIENNDLTLLPLGRTEIDGDKVFVNVAEIETAPTEEKKFEVHSRYMDLQIDIEGTDICEVSLGDLTEIAPFDTEKDIGLLDGELTSALVLGEGRFALFAVEEAHKPNVRAEGCDKVKKAVFKIEY